MLSNKLTLKSGPNLSDLPDAVPQVVLDPVDLQFHVLGFRGDRAEFHQPGGQEALLRDQRLHGDLGVDRGQQNHQLAIDVLSDVLSYDLGRRNLLAAHDGILESFVDRLRLVHLLAALLQFPTFDRQDSDFLVARRNPLPESLCFHLLLFHESLLLVVQQCSAVGTPRELVLYAIAFVVWGNC